MTAAPNQGQLKIKIEIESGPHVGPAIELAKEVIAIGRGPENDIVLSGDSKVSRQHGEIRFSSGNWSVVNLSEKNHILVNSEKVNSADLNPGDKIQFGDSILGVSFYRKPIAAPMNLPMNPPMNIQTPDIPESDANVIKIFPQPIPAFKTQDNNIIPRPVMAPHVPPIMPNPMMGQQMGYQMGRPTSGNPYIAPADNGKKRFYIILGVIALVAWFFLSGGKKVTKDSNAIRSSDQIKIDLEGTQKNIVQLKEDEEHRRTIQYKKTQENLVRGFRDFQQGQYARSRDSFQVVLNLDPENELAQRYFQLSQIKFDQQVKQLMQQGNRNREKLSWRLCMDSFSKVMTMLQGRRDNLTYNEAQKYFEACRLEAEGKY